MGLRPQIMFAGAFSVMALAYAAWFNIIVRVDVEAAQSRFETLYASRAPGRAAVYGERVLAMRREAGADEEKLAPLKFRVAETQIAAQDYARAAVLIEEALASGWARALDPRRRGEMEDALARTHIFAGDLGEAVAIYADFLDRAGDEAARGDGDDSDSLEAFFAGRIAAAADLFAENLKPTGGGEKFSGAREARLSTADRLAELGAFYAMRADGLYAAAGLLSAAYDIRSRTLGADDPAAVRTALILGPVYADMGRLDDAERLYLDAFHAQEKIKGANSPDLSLYIKLLAGVYERQGRATEAQALYEHMRALFRDAFGAQRYAANRLRDRRSDIDRPVSRNFTLPSDYAPGDLVPAADFYVPLSKNAALEEMMIRRAADEGADPREANMPARLAQVISLCRSESGERITLRSGYRSYATQRDLFRRIGRKGTVTPPGMSEHQLGLAVDIDVDGRLMRRSDAAYQCFEENAFRFGFILSYPPGNDYLPGEDSYEPWHWRYVGIPTAQLYREAGPMNKPQEFLAALPCYQERAAAGLFPLAGEPDVCLAETAVVAASAKDDTTPQPESENPKPARKLNNHAHGAGSN
ncbi:D-alanyl-D-alanine carboxypeptidase family protein [Amphiplicatus metriothermophilus]|uniref:Tetratricopeptide repeat-containing protein n=1 Tax=Amphiplicatus metriothermophilus TaxID=1519374 RepID=A0A239PQ02_9PROT|nr:D-alanyl-D-alanine carboxypeptidase family protein [Amphiplicatus metriothermophilus]MBB5518632.1 hypothetical protein [Amphiplicatus metriothermophilus]SNT72210.1 Tetratricopeptide repeat-containing protein [Amphiplicatus metriothermophilus]